MTVNDIKIGFSMHPRWVNRTGLRTFIEPLRSAGLSVLEFELDDHLDLWNEFESLMEEAVSLGLELSFHAPYRLPHSLVGFSGERRNVIERDYRPLLDIAGKWARRSGSWRTVVVHAARAKAPADRDALIADTRAFLRWALVAYPDLQFALENNHPARQDEVKVGVEREDVLQITASIQDPRLTVCWDFGHDYLRDAEEEPTLAWLSEVTHVHLHDVDEAGLDHYPLVYKNVPYQRWLRALKQEHMKGIAVLELKGERLMNWSPEQIPEILTNSIMAIACELE